MPFPVPRPPDPLPTRSGPVRALGHVRPRLPIPPGQLSAGSVTGARRGSVRASCPALWFPPVRHRRGNAGRIRRQDPAAGCRLFDPPTGSARGARARIRGGRSVVPPPDARQPPCTPLAVRAGVRLSRSPPRPWRCLWCVRGRGSPDLPADRGTDGQPGTRPGIRAPHGFHVWPDCRRPWPVARSRRADGQRVGQPCAAFLCPPSCVRVRYCPGNEIINPLCSISSMRNILLSPCAYGDKYGGCFRMVINTGCLLHGDKYGGAVLW